MNFVFNDQESFASAFYTPQTDTVTLNFRHIWECSKITDEEKIQLMTWQIEHESLHSLIYKVAGIKATTDFDNMCWAIQNRKEFMDIIKLLSRARYHYEGRCKYLGRE